MISLHNLNDLEQFGIRALTGEACRVGRRILCDVTDQGRKIICDMLGIYNNEHVFSESWNGRGASGSFMLPYGLFPDLAVWCLIHKPCPEIMLVYPGSGDGYSWGPEVIGREPGDNREQWLELKEMYDRLGKNPRIITIHTNQPGDGTRCTHQMSGRTL
jgi:hypothetical protein